MDADMLRRTYENETSRTRCIDVNLTCVVNKEWTLKAKDWTLKAKKAKAQVLGIAPLNMRSMCQRRFTIVEVVTDQHWL